MGPMTHAAPTCMYEIVIFEFPSTSITFPLEKGSGLNRAARSVTVASRPLEVLRTSQIASRSDDLNPVRDCEFDYTTPNTNIQSPDIDVASDLRSS